jgi:two-component system cell cycle sensor histidine kinase/response regulator CckA
MVGDGGSDEALQREVLELRARVAELQRAAARHEDTAGISLAEREELLREAERIAHLGTWTWDIQSGRVTWSDELFRIFGLEPGSLSPSTDAFVGHIHVDDRPRAEQATKQGLRDGVFPLFDYRIVRPDGSLRQATIYGSCLFDAEGNPRRVVGVVMDRTQGYAVEAEQRRTLSLLEEAQRSAQLGSWRFVPETNETEWSLEFRRIAGLPLDMTPHVPAFLERIHPEDRTTFQARYQKAMANPMGGALDGRLLLPSGEVRHVRLRGAFTAAPNGQRELRGTLLDITEQVRMREERAHSQKMEAVGRLAAGIAHDFNNLLTVVTGNLELMTHRLGRTPELEDSLRAAESASNLTRRLLAFGRKAQLSLSVVEPNQLVQSILTLMQRLVGDQVRLETDLAADLPLIRVDALEVERALVNLVVNARDVSPHGAVVKISTRASQEDGGDWVELTVSDEGPGIDESDLAHIFEPFYTTRAHSGGSGLGLATVLGTAEQHGGTVRVATRQAKGTVFSIVLPAAVGEMAAPVSLPQVALRTHAARKMSILIIDDEAMVAEATRRMLSSRGHRVHVAVSPSEAVVVWDVLKDEVDLVICDVVMPEVRGPELIELLATSGRTPRVVFMSGYSEEGTHAKLASVLAKPFTLSALEAAIEHAMT